MAALEQSGAPPPEADPLRWAWVGAGVVLGSVLISLFVYFVDPGLERPLVDGFQVALAVVLVGILVGYHSAGETIREAGVAGLVLLALTAIIAVWLLGLRFDPFVWLLAPFCIVLLAMAGGWVGEMLQATLEEAHEDRAVDWPWVFVSVVIGFTLSAYTVFLGQALLGLGPVGSLYVFAGSFLVTGWIVGFFSPGITWIEPGIAAGLMMCVDACFVVLFFDELPQSQVFLVGFGGGALLALAGGGLGELSQRWSERRRPRQGPEAARSQASGPPTSGASRP